MKLHISRVTERNIMNTSFTVHISQCQRNRKRRTKVEKEKRPLTVFFNTALWEIEHYCFFPLAFVSQDSDSGIVRARDWKQRLEVILSGFLCLTVSQFHSPSVIIIILSCSVFNYALTKKFIENQVSLSTLIFY